MASLCISPPSLPTGASSSGSTSSRPAHLSAGASLSSVGAPSTSAGSGTREHGTHGAPLGDVGTLRDEGHGVAGRERLDAAAGVRPHARKNAKQGRLARAVGASDMMRCPLGQVSVTSLMSGAVGRGDAQAVELEHDGGLASGRLAGRLGRRAIRWESRRAHCVDGSV